jgi:hypothetical protein
VTTDPSDSTSEQIKNVLAVVFVAVIVIGSIAKCSMASIRPHPHLPDEPVREETQSETAAFYAEGSPSPVLYLDGGKYEIVTVPTVADARRRLRGQNILEVDFSSNKISRNGATASAILVRGPVKYEVGADRAQITLKHDGSGPTIRMHQPTRLPRPVTLVWVGGPEFSAAVANGTPAHTEEMDLDPRPLGDQSNPDAIRTVRAQTGRSEDRLDAKPAPAKPHPFK